VPALAGICRSLLHRKGKKRATSHEGFPPQYDADPVLAKDSCVGRVVGHYGLSSVFPGLMGKKKIQLDNGTELDLSKIHYSDLEAMIKDIGELTVDVDGDAHVRIRCE
jgi:hypothetical protein